MAPENFPRELYMLYPCMFRYIITNFYTLSSMGKVRVHEVRVHEFDALHNTLTIF